MAILMALMLPGVQSAREVARRTQCKHNLMQVGLALHNYEAAFEVLPPGVLNPKGPIKSEPNGYHVGWIVPVLPYLDQVNIYKHINLGVSIYDPKNAAARSVFVATFYCPSSIAPGMDGDIAQSTYVGCQNDTETPIDTGNNGVLFLNSNIRQDQVTDGLANTIFVGEAVPESPFLGWASGTRATLRNGSSLKGSVGHVPSAGKVGEVNPFVVGGFSSSHVGGAQFSLGDGSVRFISELISKDTFKHLTNRADGALPEEF